MDKKPQQQEQQRNPTSSSITPLLIYQPYNIAVLLTFYSPLIITVLIIAISVIFQNLKGFGFLICLVVFSWLRSVFMEVTGSKANDIIVGKRAVCSMVQYSKYGNETFSMFFIAFSLVYLCAPMIMNEQINYWILCSFLFYFILDARVRYSTGCITSGADMFLNTVIGFVSGVISVMVFYLTNNQQYLFFNEMSSTKDMCSMPDKQTFKCKVYKNGEVIRETTSG